MFEVHIYSDSNYVEIIYIRYIYVIEYQIKNIPIDDVISNIQCYCNYPYSFYFG